jgi:hypothetical protein
MENVGLLFGHWEFLRQFGMFGYIYVLVIWYIFPRFGTLHQEKSDNPGHVILSFLVEKKSNFTSGCQ